jgi:hypothetical protein
MASSRRDVSVHERCERLSAARIETTGDNLAVPSQIEHQRGPILDVTTAKRMEVSIAVRRTTRVPMTEGDRFAVTSVD